MSPEPAPPFGAYDLRIVNLNREVPAGTTIPLTFIFAAAGSIQLDALVQPARRPATRPEPVRTGTSGSSSDQLTAR